jgi:glycosyltransferase involved in cell wall biosynthesis
MVNSKQTILFIKPVESSFIQTDQKILEKYFNVIPFSIKQTKNQINYFFNLTRVVKFIFNNRTQSVAFITWFGDYHAFLIVISGKLFRKKTIIFAGGQEAICYKELGKGVYRKKLRGWCVKIALRYATLILPNHKSLIYHKNYFYNESNPHIDGIKHYVGKIKGQVEIVPNGIDTNRIKRINSISKIENMILTVGNMGTTADFFNKGFDLFIEAARRNPDLDFMLININEKFIGWVEENYHISKIENLNVYTEFCPDELLMKYFNQAKVYVQVSITEGMPVSLSEAMLCECIPVGSNVNGIPDAIGNNGIVINKRSVEELENAIRKAILMKSGMKAREYTLENYSFEVRERKLKEIFSNFFIIS